MQVLVDSYKKYKQDCFFSEKEQELFTGEVNVLKEKIKDYNWKMNKDLCNKILALEKPPSLIINICEIFLYTLNQSNNSWSSFKVYN